LEPLEDFLGKFCEKREVSQEGFEKILDFLNIKIETFALADIFQNFDLN
jgi:hypothetical protein